MMAALRIESAERVAPRHGPPRSDLSLPADRQKGDAATIDRDPHRGPTADETQVATRLPRAAVPSADSPAPAARPEGTTMTSEGRESADREAPPGTSEAGKISVRGPAATALQKVRPEGCISWKR